MLATLVQRSVRLQRYIIFWSAKYQRLPVLLSGKYQYSAPNHPDHVPILRLPRELLDLIYNSLRIDDKVSLRLSCRHLYAGTPSVNDLIEEMRFSIDFDRELAWLSLWEHTWTRALDYLLCSGCRKYKPRAHFDGEEIPKPSKQRKCFAYTACMYITPDHVMSFTDVWLHSVHAYHRGGHIYTTHPGGYKRSSSWAAFIPLRDHGAACISNPIYLHGSKADGAYLEYSMYFSIEPSPSSQLTTGEIKTQLSSRAISLCPHIQSDDERIIDAVHQCIQRGGLTNAPGPWVNCSYCGMQSSIQWRANDHRVTIRVLRRLGHLTCAGDPQWLAVLDNPQRPVYNWWFRLGTRLRYLARSEIGRRLAPRRTCELTSAIQHLNPNHGLWFKICFRVGVVWRHSRLRSRRAW